MTVYENDEPENITTWNTIDQFMVLNEKPEHGEEVSFKVSFDPNLEPSYNAIHQGVARDSLALLVAGMNTARIWRTKVISHEVSLGSGTGREFYLAADLPGHRDLVRDAAWAPGSIRGYDIVGTVCKDGLIRVFEVRTPPKEGATSQRNDYSAYPVTPPVVRSSENGAKGGPSGIGAGLATVRLGTGTRQQDGESQVGQVPHEVKLISQLNAHGGQVWRIRFDDDGQMMGTTGDDGKLMLWRREPSGTWSLSGELAMARGIAEQADLNDGPPT
jgi:nucleoporin SEH1